MSHPRIEEVSDSSGGSDSDPDIDDIETFMPSHPASASDSTAVASNANPTLTNPRNVPATAQNQNRPSPAQPGFDANTAKRWVCLYPVYFDASRSRAEGRRVGKELAVLNPLARTMADAAAHVGLRVFIDVGKTHPKDWANSGRVKVELRDENGALKRSGIKNKHHLYIHIANYLKSHPTDPRTPFKLPIRGMPMPEEPPGPPAAPRGKAWKMGTILPLHSPAVTGGGVSENLMKDMMNEMAQSGGMPGGMGGMPPNMGALANMIGGGGAGGGGSGTSTPGASKKKDKKKGK